MKRILWILVAILLLGGCWDGGGQPLPETITETVGVEMETVLPETRPPRMENRGETSAAPGQNQAAFSLLENDNSIRNAQGDILVKIRYEQVILDTSVERWQKINERILEDYLLFLEDMVWLQETSVETWEERVADMGAVYGNLLSECTAKVTHNSGDMFSVRMTRNWFLGGVYTCDYYGMTFNLATGDAVKLAQLSDLDREEFALQLKQMVCDALAEDFDVLFEDPALVLETYTLEDFSFYVEDGELVLVFPTYTFGPGAMGPLTVKTGLYPQL